MTIKPNFLMLCALLCLGAPAPASAQTTVYKCLSKGSVTYSQQPCGRMVNTDEAPVPVRPKRKAREVSRAASAAQQSDAGKYHHDRIQPTP